MNHCRDPRVLVSLATTRFISQAILSGATPQAANRSTADIVTAIAEDGNDLNAEKAKFFLDSAAGWQTEGKTHVAL